MAQTMDDRAETLARIASLYYEHGHTQAEVASAAGVSRSTVSRLLREAKESGIVEITVHYPWKTVGELGRRLQRRFSLRHVEVLAGLGRPESEVVAGMGYLAARYLAATLHDGAILGVSWGEAVQATVRSLARVRLPPITVVQMVGAIGEGDPGVDGPDLTRMLAQLCAGQSRCLHAPLVVESSQVREALVRERRIGETLDLARRADAAIVGVGSVVPATSGTMWDGYLAPELLAQVRERGAVGNVCARHYDGAGQPVNLELDERVVGIDLASLRQIEHVVGVAGGRIKAQAIRGALKGRHVNVLITDQEAAEEILLLEPASFTAMDTSRQPTSRAR